MKFMRILQLLAISAVLFVWPNGALWASDAVPHQQEQTEFSAELSFVTGEKRRKLPFMIYDGFLLVEVLVEGKAVWALLDNGAASTAIDKKFADENDIETRDFSKPFLTNTGPVSRSLTESIEVELPGVLTMKSPVSAIDLDPVSKLLGRKITLILGREYFTHTVLIVSFKQQVLDIGPSSSLRISGEGSLSKLPQLTLEGEAPLVSLTVNGITARVALDLGYNGDISLAEKIWDAAIDNDTSSFFAGSMSAEGSTRAVRKAQGQSVILAGQQIDDVSVVRDTALPNSGDGLLGLGTLRRFELIIINFQEGKMLLFPRPTNSGS